MSVTVYRFWCPACWEEDLKRSTGYCESTGSCLICHGQTMLADADGWDEDLLHRIPVPDGVMKKACGGCAYRPGSPESESGQNLPDDEGPFACHRKMGMADGGHHGGGYRPVAYHQVGGKEFPLGHLICAGWWAKQSGLPLPEEEFRDDSPRVHGPR